MAGNLIDDYGAFDHNAEKGGHAEAGSVLKRAFKFLTNRYLVLGVGFVTFGVIIFRAPILVKGIKPFVSCWEKPITIARHAYGDVYRDTEFLVDGPARADLVITYPDGRQESQTIFEYKDSGVVQGLYNTDKSISAFATSCFEYALDTKQDLWFATKDTISKKYDGRFKEIFQNIYDTQYKEKFEAAGITYFYTLIDDAVGDSGPV